MNSIGLTVRWEVNFTFIGEKRIALSLGLELRAKLLGGDLGVWRVTGTVVGIHVRVSGH